MKKILAINGSYREGGIIDQVMELFVRQSGMYNIDIEVISLRNFPVEFCLNCRVCCQEPGEYPGRCVIEDNMASLINKIEKAEGYVLASPTNFYTVTAIYKRFLERLIPYAYWPWGMNAPVRRKKNTRRKKAILISSCAAPATIGRFVYGTERQLKLTAKTLGADIAGTICFGQVSKQVATKLSDRYMREAEKMIAKLSN